MFHYMRETETTPGFFACPTTPTQTSCPFCATCTPFFLHAFLMTHLTMSEHNAANDVIERDLYIDIEISCFSQKSYFRNAVDLLPTGGFNPRSWTSNSTKLHDLA
ncbi:hypothetical protein MAR_022957 [Mya arenaria]|uniref:C2H2-type domain-containing protein n=1 Tax=Mya arenaria TaxID=6604 RepID=A0ABY7DPW1_MYAAR|nr:hypothetical protein MAR_022957 [Mya arenaria]